MNIEKFVQYLEWYLYISLYNFTYHKNHWYYYRGYNYSSVYIQIRKIQVNMARYIDVHKTPRILKYNRDTKLVSHKTPKHFILLSSHSTHFLIAEYS